MSSPAEMKAGLQAHLGLAREVLALVEREGQALRSPDNSAPFESHPAKKALLARLEESVLKLKEHRSEWTRLDPATRSANADIHQLIRQNQDLTMKIIVLDRENEQALLRRGLVPPREIPSANRQRPHFVADLYRRQARV